MKTPLQDLHIVFPYRTRTLGSAEEAYINRDLRVEQRQNIVYFICSK